VRVKSLLGKVMLGFFIDVTASYHMMVSKTSHNITDKIVRSAIGVCRRTVCSTDSLTETWLGARRAVKP